MTPQVAEQHSNLTKGCAWFASKEEIAGYEKELGSEVIFLPAPVALASEVEGTGLVVWHEDGGSSLLWLEDYLPKLYKYGEDSEGSPEELAKWVRDYAAATGGSLPAEKVRIFEAEELSPEAVTRAAEATFAASPALGRLDLSNRGASAAEHWESFFAHSFRMLRILSVAALLFFVFSLMLLLQNDAAKAAFEAAPAEIYRLVTGTPSRSPLSSVMKKLRLISGAGVQLTLEGTLANIASAWKALPASSGMKLDAVRYGRERTELEGQSPATANIEELRSLLSKNGFSVKLGEVQQIPGSGLRFTLYLTEGGRETK